MRASSVTFAWVMTSLLLVACHNDPLSVGGDAGDWLYDAATPACSVAKSEADCRALSGCVVDACLACSCTPSFVGCRAANDLPTSCPLFPCPAQKCCRSESDCRDLAGTLCALPPTALGCGPCNAATSNCAMDSDCVAMKNGICASTPCSCVGAVVLSCQAGCASDTDCSETERCGTDHRCGPRACDTACAGNYRCATSTSTCERKACTADAECGIPGYCVLGACSKYVGQCVAPTA